MQTTYRALSALLSYPTPELVAALPEIRAIFAAERRLPRRDAAALDALCAALAAADLFDAQERYVDTFDRGRATSLNLFEHVHGDSRDRGTAMLDLKGVYERAGYAFVGSELPDYVPAVLEFLSTQPAAAAGELLGECAHILRRIGEALAERDSPYAAVFAALLAAIGADGLSPKQAKRAPRTPEKTLDEEWAEEPVIFGPGAAPSCGAGTPASSVIQFMPRPAAPL
jgi:nitrate reductase molybdenum cofactor assembly chaperone NarJ/NarW